MENRAEKVNKIFMDCLYKESELSRTTFPFKVPDGAVVVEGIRSTYGLHPVRLASHKEEIRECLTGLPKEFYKDGGGGWSFLNLCMDEEDIQWGEHANCEELCVLAIASGFGKWLLDRELWSSFPGGMPYIVFDLNPVIV